MTCKEKILEQLATLPSEWACKIADVICDTIAIDIACEDVKDCETLTTLSVFSVSGNTVSITYTGENGTPVIRSFDFSSLINNMLDNVDPKCIASPAAWSAMTHAQQWQAIIDKVCDDCGGILPTTTSTTSTTTIA